MRGVLIVGVIAAGMMLRSAYGQSSAEQASFRSTPLEGIHLYTVSVFSGYSTSAYPVGLGYSPLGVGQLGGDASYGGSATLGWQYHRQRWDFSLMYSGTYGGMVRYSDANAFSQSLSVSASRALSPKWTVSLSGAGADSTTAEFLYQPTTIGVISQVPATMDDLAAAFSVGQFSSSQIASTLTGSPVLESPARTLLLGARILSYSGQASLSYAHSSRLRFHLASFAAGGQQRLGNSAAPEANYVTPRSIGINAGMGMNYMLSPRTQVGLDVSSSRIDNRYQAGYTTQGNASLGRKMGIHWFLTVHAGGAINQLTSQVYGAPAAKQIIGGGSIGFRTYQHTLVGSYDRTSADTYGLAIGSTTSLTAAWTWHHPGSRWNVFTSFAQQQVRNTGYVSLSGWEASGGVAQTLNSHLRMTAQYVYLNNSGGYLGIVNNLAVHSVRVTLNWAPQVAAR